MVKKLVGSVMDVLLAQGCSQEDAGQYGGVREYPENKTTIAKDLPRTALVDFSGKTHRDFTNECQQEENYHGHYIQGSYDGAGVIDIYQKYILPKMMMLHDEIEGLSQDPTAKKEKMKELELFLKQWVSSDSRKSLRFAYRDDDGVLCAVGFVFNLTTPGSWILQTFKKTIEPKLELRQTTLFVQGEYTPANTSLEIDLAILPAEIKLALNSEKVNGLISGLIGEDGNVSEEKFNELNLRIVTNRNLDNRDAKRLQLEELLHYAGILLLNSEQNSEQIKFIRECSLSDPNFFKGNNFLDIVLDLVKQVDTKERQSSDRLSDAIWHLTVNAIQLELQASNNNIYLALDEREALALQAKQCREKREVVIGYDKNIKIFQEKLNNLGSDNDSASKQQFYRQGVMVLDSVKAIVGDDPIKLKVNDLSVLNEVLECCSLAIDEPENSENNGKLAKLSQTISSKSSTLWMILGSALLVFTGIALVVAGVLSALPSGGASLLLVAVGATTLSGIGGLAIKQGAESDLATSVLGFFKKTITQVKKEEVNNEPGLDLKA